MTEKMKSAIEKIIVNEGTFDGEELIPNYINFFYGKNGAGKTSISREIEAGGGLTWAAGEVPSNYQILVYNQDYIDLHFKTLDKVHGIFTLNEGDEEDDTEDKIAKLEEKRKEIVRRQTEISGENGERDKIAKARQTAESTFQGACLRNTRLMREKYKPAFNKFSRNPSSPSVSVLPRQKSVTRTNLTVCSLLPLRKVYAHTIISWRLTAKSISPRSQPAHSLVKPSPAAGTRSLQTS